MTEKKQQFLKTIFFMSFIFFLSISELYTISGRSLPGELNIAHSHLQEQAKCILCHTPEYKTDSVKCLVCHKEIQKRIESSRGYHQDKNEGCNDCHPEHGGKKSKLIDFEVEDFDHKDTGYVLKGAHSRAGACSDCHSGPNSIKKNYSPSYLLKNRQCSACHNDVHNGMYPDCEECHSSNDWSVDIWNP